MNLDNFYELLMEEWKPFPKDKVNKSIEKKEKSGDGNDALKAHTQKAVKNYRTKMTDVSKARQKFIGRDAIKQNNQRNKHTSERDKAIRKMDKLNDKWAGKKYDKVVKKPESKLGKKYQKDEKKFNKQLNKAQTSTKRRDGMDAVHMSDKRKYNIRRQKNKQNITERIKKQEQLRSV